MDQGSNKNHSPAYNFAPTVTKFCVMWEGLSLPHDTKFGNCRCKIVDSRAFPSWSLIHGLRWSGLIKAEPGVKRGSAKFKVTNYTPKYNFHFLSAKFIFFLNFVWKTSAILLRPQWINQIRSDKDKIIDIFQNYIFKCIFNECHWIPLNFTSLKMPMIYLIYTGSDNAGLK